MQLRELGAIPSDARFLDGHFPGNPIVPGAVLLGLAAQSLRDAGYEIDTIIRMKFQRPLLPEQPFEVTCSFGDAHSTLVWLHQGEAIATARVILRDKCD